MASALEGIRVVEASTAFAGPYCCKNLADLGAEVIKIESSTFGLGDATRWNGKTVEESDGKKTIVSPIFSMFNRNKKSITVNLKSIEGQQIVKDLVRISDVFFENYSPGTMDSLNLGYSELSKVNPRIIYCSLSGFGQTGPFRDRRGYDLIFQALSGLMTQNDQGVPTKIGTSLTDYYAGLHSAVGILAALHHRSVTGRGQWIDISMYDCTMTTLNGAVESITHFGEKRSDRPPGYTSYRCKDGHIVIGMFTEGQWRDFFKLIGRDDCLTDPRTKDQNQRVKNARFVDSIIENWTETLPVEETYRKLLDIKIPAARIQDVGETLNDPQLRAREMFVPVSVPGLERAVETTGSPLKMSETPGKIQRGVPRLGESTLDVLKLLGYSDQKVKELLSSKAVG